MKITANDRKLVAKSSDFVANDVTPYRHNDGSKWKHRKEAEAGLACHSDTSRDNVPYYPVGAGV